MEFDVNESFTLFNIYGDEQTDFMLTKENLVIVTLSPLYFSIYQNDDCQIEA